METVGATLLAVLAFASPAAADAAFDPAVNYAGPTRAQSVATADFNGDGDVDLAVDSGSRPNDVLIRLGNGDGTFAAGTTVATGSTTATV
jgi:hypothetical protein